MRRAEPQDDPGVPALSRFYQFNGFDRLPV
jgi:hypothetical protein